MANYSVRGKQADDSSSTLQLLTGEPEVESVVEVSQSARSDVEPVSVSAKPDSLVEVELEDGTVFFTSLERLLEDTEQTGLRTRGSSELPTRYPSGATAERGITGIAIKALKFLGYEPADKLPKKAVSMAATMVEKQLAGDPGMYRIDEKGLLTPEAIEPGPDPVLVFIHGTASSTSGGFGSLWREPEQSIAWNKLLKHYRGRVYGFEHRTLSEFPALNAVQFLDCLPDQSAPPLNLVSHSRGGLVGDLIAHGGLDEVVFPASMLKNAGVHEEQLEIFQRLNECLASKAPDVARFVRVACPAGGTTLASGRLDIYLSLIFSLLGKTPGVGPLLGAVGDLVATAAKLRTEPDALPGLEAQMPESSFIRLLNTSGHRLESDLSVIAGDSDGLLKNLANLFYWTANDLVVDTRSMYLGAVRRKRAWYRAEGADVHHCNYFARTETVAKMVDGLTSTKISRPGFEWSEPRGELRGSVPPAEPEDGIDKPAVILIPGIMGSHLSVPEGDGRNRVWLDISDLMQGKMDQLGIEAEDVLANAVVKSAYGDLRKFLHRRQQHVIPFPYDWRRSVASASEKLDELVKRRLAASPDQPIRLVAHSMGGLVARHFIAASHGASDSAWDRISANGGRLIQLGTPNGGSYLIPYLLRGKEKLLKMLAALDIDNSREKWIRLIARFPGLLEMSPQAADRDFFKVATWSNLQAKTDPTANDLNSAEVVVKKLLSADLSDHAVLYVAGKADETPFLAPGDIKFSFTHEGDGRVTWASGIPEGIEPWYIDTKHGSLCDHKPSFAGLLELINQGTTDKLSRRAPAKRSIERQTPVLGIDTVDVFPDQDALERAALGMEDMHFASVLDRKARKCRVRVVHGNLSWAQNPVMCGHYAGDPIIHAERALDSRLGGVLTHRQQLDLYPGPIGSHEIVLNETSQEPGGRGAIIVGLGNTGELSPGKLSTTIETAVVRYASISANTQELGLSTLLIGSGETGFSLEMVVESILTGVKLANQRLSQASETANQLVDLEIIELHEDLALRALHVLREMEPTRLQGFDVHPDLARSTGGQVRASYRENPGWWTPFTIKKDKLEEALSYITSGRRARVSADNLYVQSELINQLLRNPLSTEGDNVRLRHALFELLIPRHYKQSAADGNNLILSLDRFAAQFPWEMMADRLSNESLPLSVKAGMVRKLQLPAQQLVPHTEDNRALVVGDPPSSLNRLPGAEAEAKAVADRLAEKWSVIRQIRNDAGSKKSKGAKEIDASSIVSAALTDDFRIIHLAGHGIYDPENPQQSGMVIGNHADDTEQFLLLTPAEIAQMRNMPELVFINCCHLGRVEELPQFHLLAANLATQFIRDGVKAVVAAGWAVGDREAVTFAETFYDEMFHGSTFGKAVLNARRATHRAAMGGNTWAAYQCYGDPGFSLMMDPGIRRKIVTGRWDNYVDPREIVVELDNLHSQAKTKREKAGLDQARESLLRNLEELKLSITRKGWGEDGRILRGMARTYAELMEFESAAELYERAKSSLEGSVTLRDLEQLANLRARRAGEVVDADPGKKAEANAAIRLSINEIKDLLRMAPTAERWSIKGSAHKRLARIEGVGKRRQNLVDMTNAYNQACRYSSKRNYALYPKFNVLTGIFLLGGPWNRVPGGLRGNKYAKTAAFNEAMATAHREAAELAETSRDFWARAYQPDFQLLDALVADSLGDQLDEIVAAYRSLFKYHGSPKSHDSVKAQFDFLADFLNWSPTGKRVTPKRKRQSGEMKNLAARLN